MAQTRRSFGRLLGRLALVFICSATLAAAPQVGSGSETTLKDQAAWDSPQGKALAAFLRASRAGDTAALKGLLVPHQAATLDGPNAAAFLAHLKRTALDPTLARFDSLTVNAQGSSALATISGRYESGEVTKRYTINKSDAGWWISI